jgi:tRNA-Thr(GGU) m(6)t(6)A37 methyltransferase TsaA
VKFELNPIGVMHSCFKQRFGTPKQARRAPAARGWIEFTPPYDREEAFVGLDGFSHLWLLFLFHENLDKEVSLSAQPPHAGGETYGLWATRSPNRPAGIGQSLVELERIERNKGKVKLHLKGIDLIENTPIVDIKPYLPYVDAIPDARSPFLQQAPEPELTVGFSAEAEQQLAELEHKYAELRQLIVEVLQYDPRPVATQHDNEETEFSMPLYDLTLRFSITGRQVSVIELTPA